MKKLIISFLLCCSTNVLQAAWLWKLNPTARVAQQVKIPATQHLPHGALINIRSDGNFFTIEDAYHTIELQLNMAFIMEHQIQNLENQSYPRNLTDKDYHDTIKLLFGFYDALDHIQKQKYIIDAPFDVLKNVERVLEEYRTKRAAELPADGWRKQRSKNTRLKSRQR